jgi:hypothetical protein
MAKEGQGENKVIQPVNPAANAAANNRSPKFASEMFFDR